ncbi:MAG TPA: hypothetical protein VMH39_05990 [Gemmatimonadaceae bacterium]|nr:hypothetical protein [Gemmatimonadaceae bacterium]
MNSRNRTTYDALRRARLFLTRYAASLNADTNRRAAAALDDAIRLVSRWTFWRWATQLLDEGLRTSMHTLRRDLRVEIMRTVITIAREQLRDELELQALRLPKRHTPFSSFILTAHLMADVVGRHQRAFEAHGLPRDAAERLRAGAERLTVLAAKRVSVRAARALWRRRLDEQFRCARADLATLDVTMRASLWRNPALTAEWVDTRRATGPVEPEYALNRRRA